MKSELEIVEYLKVLELQRDEYREEFDDLDKNDKTVYEILLDIEARIDTIKFILGEN